MATTWTGTSSNQLVTYEALYDAYLNNYVALNYPSSFPATSKQVMTKADCDYEISSVSLDTAEPGWSDLSSTRCPTKLTLQKALVHSVDIYASKMVGAANYDITMTVTRGTTTIYNSTKTVGSTFCVLRDRYSSVRYSDVVTINASGGGYTSIEGYAAYDTVNCGGGNLTCTPITFTNFVEKYFINISFQAKSPYSQCL